MLLLLLLLLLLPGWAQEESKPPFSGETTSYEDSVNGYRLLVPVEFALKNKGYSTNWEGPSIKDFVTSLFVNVTPMPGVHPMAVYEGVIRSKKADRSVTAIQPVKFPMKLKGKPVYGFTCRESDIDPGTGQPKADGDHYRYHLFVWGNERAFQLTLGTSVAAHKAGTDINPVWEKVWKSFTPLKTP